MDENVEMTLEMAEESMTSSLGHLEKALSKIRAGKATPSMLNSVTVEYYGAATPLNQVANVNAPEPRLLTVQPFDRSSMEAIEKGIQAANLGLNPQNNGEMILVAIPILTEERRRDLTKQVRAAGEDAKVGIRNARKEANDSIKSFKNDGLDEDSIKAGEGEVQKLTDKYSSKVDALVSVKEQDIMTV